jgi:peptide/nickel transport system substrate-binding protein
MPNHTKGAVLNENSAAAHKAITRRTFVKIGGVGLAGLSFGGLLAACSPSTTGTNDGKGDEPKPTQVIIALGTGNEPEAGFDPLINWGGGEHGHEPLIQSTLITTTTAMGFNNDLATAYSCSDDGLTWTFTIRSDVKFSDGMPLSAKDVAFTINGIIAAEGSETDLSMVDNAKATNDSTVVLHLNKPFNALLYTLAVVGIVPEHAYGTDYGNKPIGSGRYMLEQWDKGQQVILVANPNYYGAPPKIQRIVAVFMDEDAALAAARAGQVDVAATSATFSAQSLPGYSLFAAKSVDSRGISLPTVAPGKTIEVDGAKVPVGNAVTSDLAVRQALNYGVDRELLVQNVLNGYGTVAYSVGDGMPWSSDNMKVAVNVEQAHGFMTDGGWKLGEDGIYAKVSQRAAFELWYPANDTVRQALASEFANQVKQVGIEVSVKGASWDDLYPHAYSDPILWGWGTNSPVELYTLNHSKSESNFASYANKTTDKYLDAALATSTIEESYPLWQKAQWDGKVGICPKGEATWVWFANIDHLYFVREGLKIAEQKLHPHGHGWALTNNIDQWSW